MNTYYLVGERTGSTFVPEFRISIEVEADYLASYCDLQSSGFTQYVFRPVADGSWSDVQIADPDYFLADLDEMFEYIHEYV